MNENEFRELHGFFLEDLKVGQEAMISKTVTESDVVFFSGVSGDNNPVHISDEFAEKTLFKKRVAHGFFTASLISTVIGTKLPGPGSIYLKQSIQFLAPVFIGETIKVIVKVKSINFKKKRVTLETYCEKNRKRVLEGEAEILVQSKLM
ncbi:MAG: (R)-hydratase [Rickettsiales bacterium]|nr:(R)-hydratase [Rickettsiales bacterium]|tara:strand:+ start:534 stop:980 length:447 start_codon:yes stop_codon:yes gene_type:complete